MRRAAIKSTAHYLKNKMTVMSTVGSLEDEALKRKERLKALRKKDDTEEPPAKKAATNEAAKLPKPVFRSYKPLDETLKESQLPRAQAPEVKEQVKEQLEAAKPEPLVEEVDLMNLAPRKPDWDLKRDVSKKLAKLERRTQRAIAELIRERLQLGNADLVSAVDANATAAQEDDD